MLTIPTERISQSLSLQDKDQLSPQKEHNGDDVPSIMEPRTGCSLGST